MWTEKELDLLTLTEPLACVLHAYKKMPVGANPQEIVVLGVGPIGALHVVEIQQRYPTAKISIVEPHAARRALAVTNFPQAEVLAQVPRGRDFDWAVVANSDPCASLLATHIVRPGGVVLLFSGLNLLRGQAAPTVEGISLETVHRREEIRILENGVRLIGSSGYHPSEINESSQKLLASPETYQKIQTRVIDGLAGEPGRPGIADMLNHQEVFAKNWKALYRLSDQDRFQRVVPDDSLGHAVLEATRLSASPAEFHRVKMLRVSVCHTDRRVLQGTKASKVHRNLILGHEGVGIIEESLDPKMIGQVVVILPHHFLENDELHQMGLGYLSRKMEHLGIHRDGIFAGLVDLPADAVFALQKKEGDARVAA
jgi:threonine dehydrogenase-like Zn-dependent dehydrogenase